jgi:hypothetical protein
LRRLNQRRIQDKIPIQLAPGCPESVIPRSTTLIPQGCQTHSLQDYKEFRVALPKLSEIHDLRANYVTRVLGRSRLPD